MASAPLSDLDSRNLTFFCPFCGVKNNVGQTQCFVCGKKMPSFAADASPGPGPGPSRSKTVSGSNKALANAPVAARIGDRMIAVFLDTALLAALMLFVFAVVWTQEEKLKSLPLVRAGLFAAGGAVVVIFAFLYYWLLEGAFGATLGKAIIGVRVGSKNGRRGGFRASAIRNAFRILEGLPLYVPAFVVALFSRARRRLGDFAANTVVIEYDLPVVARAAVVLGWLALIGTALWGTYLIWPNWFRIPLLP